MEKISERRWLFDWS